MIKLPLSRGDIPLSAVDFHISSIAEELIQNDSISAAARAVPALGEQNQSDLLRRAMWLFRSSLNLKTELSTASKARSSQEMQTLQPLWQVSRAAADAWSADYIRRRFC